MRSRILFAAAALFLAGFGVMVADAGAGDPDLERGVRQVQEGEFEQAVVTLRAALPRLREGSGRDLARAYVYLGIAHLGLDDTTSARASFQDALRADSSIKLTAEEYPPRVLRAFEEARAALPPPEPPPAAVPAPAAATPPTAVSAPPAKPAADRPAPPAPASAAKTAAPAKKKSSLPLILLGVGAAAGGGVALAGGGGGSSTPASSSPPVTSPPAPTGEVRLVGSFPPTGGTIPLSADPRAGTTLPEITFDVVYGADVADARFEINLWRGADLCHSTGVAYADRLDSPGTQYRAGTTARYHLRWWTTRQPGCGDAYTTDRFEFAWGGMASPLFVQNLSVGWRFSR